MVSMKVVSFPINFTFFELSIPTGIRFSSNILFDYNIPIVDIVQVPVHFILKCLLDYEICLIGEKFESFFLSMYSFWNFFFLLNQKDNQSNNVGQKENFAVIYS